jgi:carbon monoxide dehydrogenase subunit G
MSMVQQAIEVSAPLHTVYEHLTVIENYPRFMAGVERVTPIGDRQTHWVMEVDGHRREFDAQITEMSVDERVSWATMDGPLVAESITVRPMGEMRTQVIAQLQADIAFLMPSDRHGQESLNRRLKDDLSTFKTLVESGRMGPGTSVEGASTKAGVGPRQVAGRSHTTFGAGPQAGSAAPGTVAARTRGRSPSGAAGDASAETVAGAELIATPELMAGRSGSAPMGGRTPTEDVWGDGMINEEDRGSAHDC